LSDAGSTRESVEVTRSVRLRNPAGLHARPCQKIATIANRFTSEFRVGCGDHEVNGRSILELMTLCAPVESTLVLHARGADAEALVRAVLETVEAGFDEMDPA
jgi:phosphotransferase system HPr (HPr) family protein